MIVKNAAHSPNTHHAKIKLKDLLFGITKEDVQIKAMEKIGRRLAEDELKTAEKELEAGLTFDIDAVYSAIFDEIVNQKA